MLWLACINLQRGGPCRKTTEICETMLCTLTTLGPLQMRIADRLAALADAGPLQAAPLPAPAPAPQQIGFLPSVESGRWAPLALPPGARAPPPGSVWAYSPAPTPGQTGRPCLHCWRR